MSDALKHVNFDIIRYANCWEDAGVLLHNLKEKAPRRIAIISSAGDNALALLSTAPESVLAFDISLPQLYLSELKQTAFSRLDYDELLRLLDVRAGLPEERIRLFRHISPHLSHPANEYWQDRTKMIERGLIHTGKFERYFELFRTYCLPLVHSREAIRKLLQPKSDNEQRIYYRKKWNNLRWRLLMSIFFSKAVMGRAGRDPQFLKQVQLSVSDYIRKKAADHLQSSEATHNHLLHFIFTGNFGEVLPHYLRPENYAAIRANIGRLTFSNKAADDIVSMQAHDAYCLSNIFEYFPQEHFNSTVKAWSDLLPSGAQLLFWNLMVPRSFSIKSPESFTRIASPEYVPDAGFFYSAFLNEQRI